MYILRLKKKGYEYGTEHKTRSARTQIDRQVQKKAYTHVTTQTHENRQTEKKDA